MKLILKYRNKIVSIGLIPIIVTLIGLHFFPNTLMLCVGFALSIVMLVHNIVRMRDLNFFLLLGTLGIGVCFFLRLIWGYKYVPLNTITPTVEFSLLVFAFLYYTAPEIYNSIVRKLGIRNCFSYRLETKIIVVLSSIHLLSIYLIGYFNFEWGRSNIFILFNVIPVSIYIICLAINITGIRIAAGIDTKNSPVALIRVALLCNGKILLARNGKLWDLPHQVPTETQETKERNAEHAAGAIKGIISTDDNPRFIMKYLDNNISKETVNLYILPVKDEDDINENSGHFFSFDEIEKAPELYSKNIIKEFTYLKNAAEMWKEFQSTCK